MKKSALAAVAAAFLLAGSLAAGAQTIPSMQSTAAEAQDAIVTFFTQDSVGDVQLGRLGLAKSRNASVRSLAQTLVNDHTMTADLGYRVAEAIRDRDLQFKPGDDNAIVLAHLVRYSGAQFDREYVSSIVDAHKSDIQTAQDALETATNSQVTSYLQTVLRVDRKHLAIAQAVRGKL